MLGTVLFWWGLFKSLLSFLHMYCGKILNMGELDITGGWGHQNFRITKVGHGPKSVGNH